MINKKTLTIILIPILIISIGVYGNSLLFDNTNGKVISRLSFNFEGVDEGLNPHGGVFDAQKIKNIEVIQRALDQVGPDLEHIEAKELSQNMIVRGIVPEDAIDRITPKGAAENNSRLEGVQGGSYNPTQYEVTLYLDKQLKISKQEATLVLDAIIENYQKYFAETYRDTSAIERAIVPIDPDRYDYSEYIMLIEGQLEIIRNYLEAKEQVAKDFRSSNTALSFGDLIAQVELIRDVEVGKVKALVDSFIITKDPEKLTIVSESMVKRMKLEKEKYSKQAEDLTQAATSYEKDKTVILGSGELLQELEEIEESEEETLYDQLIKQAIVAETRANKMDSKQSYYEALLAGLNSEEKNISQADAKIYKEEVEGNIIYIANQMEETMSNITTTVNDYYTEEVFEGSITPLTNSSYQSNFRANFIKDTLLIGALVGLMAMFGIIYYLTRKEFITK